MGLDRSKDWSDGYENLSKPEALRYKHFHRLELKLNNDLQVHVYYNTVI